MAVPRAPAQSKPPDVSPKSKLISPGAKGADAKDPELEGDKSDGKSTEPGCDVDASCVGEMLERSDKSDDVDVNSPEAKEKGQAMRISPARTPIGRTIIRPDRQAQTAVPEAADAGANSENEIEDVSLDAAAGDTEVHAPDDVIKHPNWQHLNSFGRRSSFSSDASVPVSTPGPETPASTVRSTRSPLSGSPNMNVHDKVDAMGDCVDFRERVNSTISPRTRALARSEKALDRSGTSSARSFASSRTSASSSRSSSSRTIDSASGKRPFLSRGAGSERHKRLAEKKKTIAFNVRSESASLKEARDAELDEDYQRRKQVYQGRVRSSSAVGPSKPRDSDGGRQRPFSVDGTRPRGVSSGDSSSVIRARAEQLEELNLSNIDEVKAFHASSSDSTNPSSPVSDGRASSYHLSEEDLSRHSLERGSPVNRVPLKAVKCTRTGEGDTAAGVGLEVAGSSSSLTSHARASDIVCEDIEDISDEVGIEGKISDDGMFEAMDGPAAPMEVPQLPLFAMNITTTNASPTTPIDPVVDMPVGVAGMNTDRSTAESARSQRLSLSSPRRLANGLSPIGVADSGGNEGRLAVPAQITDSLTVPDDRSCGSVSPALSAADSNAPPSPLPSPTAGLPPEEEGKKINHRQKYLFELHKYSSRASSSALLGRVNPQDFQKSDGKSKGKGKKAVVVDPNEEQLFPMRMLAEEGEDTPLERAPVQDAVERGVWDIRRDGILRNYHCDLVGLHYYFRNRNTRSQKVHKEKIGTVFFITLGDNSADDTDDESE